MFTTASNVRDELPRVSVDALQDWQRIKENLHAAGLASLERKLTSEGLLNQRHLFLPHLVQFLNETFNIAKPNLRVNGRNLDDYNEDEQDIDQFDESLDRRVWSLSDQRLKWDLEIVLKRRGTPFEVERMMCDLISYQRDQSVNQELNHEDIQKSEDEIIEDDQALVHLGTSRLINELSETLPDQLERSNRVKEVDGEIRSLRV